jgi:hypothetical protein
MLAAVSSYFFSPASSGAIAVNTSPQRLHRNFSNSYTVAAMGLPFDPHQYAGAALGIDFTALTIRTLVARLQRSVRNLDFARAPIGCGAVAPMPRHLTFTGVLSWRSVLLFVGLDAGLFHHLSSLLRARVTQQLYGFEQEIRGRSPAEREEVRQARSRPVLETIQSWMKATLQKLSQKSDVAVAIRYALERWSALVRYCEDGRVEMDNNAAERRCAPSHSGGGSKAFGILLDMAEIWELYVAKLLQIGLPALRVNHTGRSTEHFRWLLSSAADGDKFGSLRPDIVIADHQGHCLAIADAKYKTNRINASNRTGVITDDLYQLSAYLSGFGDPTSRLEGFLNYPADEGGQVASRLSPKKPWTLSSAPQRNI